MVRQFPLSVNSGKIIAATNESSSGKCRKIISHGGPGCEWARRYQLYVAGAPWYRISHIILYEDAGTGFLWFKEQGPFKFKNKVSAVEC